MNDAPRHVGIIMDGNGRWARQRHLPRTSGHKAGVEAAREVALHASRLGIGCVTLYAFSSDNWQRPPLEVRGIFGLVDAFVERDLEPLDAAGIRLNFVGRRDRLQRSTLATIERCEARTRANRGMLLRVAIDYSARDAIVLAAASLAGTPIDRPRFDAALKRVIHSEPEVADIDLLVRSGGEQRLSDFFLWECAYAELYFSDVLWPDFHGEHLDAAIATFARRQRRFGTTCD
jgi:undecaprenyl diphosphate synthase